MEQQELSVICPDDPKDGPGGGYVEMIDNRCPSKFVLLTCRYKAGAE